jgi:hypothetical protein
MTTLQRTGALLLTMATMAGQSAPVHAQCCLSELFAGCGTCFRKAPVYAVAPVAAPVAAPVVAAPMMVPVQQTSYVPETTYRTQYQNVPVTTYKPSCEIDPCTGCPRECYQPITQYVQQAVNVPVTQYRAVTTTKYVQMQPGYTGTPGYPATPIAAPLTAPASPAASPFAAPIQTSPQAWGAAGADVPQQLIPGQPSMTAPALPAGTYQQPMYQQPPYQQPTFQQPITPQSGGMAVPPALASPALQPTQPPALAPAPSLRPIPDLQRNGGGGNGGPGRDANGSGASGNGQSNGQGNGNSTPAGVGGTPVHPSLNGGTGMPVLPGNGPGAATGAFPRLLEPTNHTTSWQPATNLPTMSMRSYPTAALPTRLTQ